MRVANKTLFDNIRANLGRVTTAMSKANTVVSTAKRINQISDDPVGLVTVLDLRSSLANVEQLERNIEMGRSWLDSAESALSQTEELLAEGKTLCVQMASATQGSSERANAATLVDGYLRQLLSLANTEVGGKYVFSGTKTDIAPFAFDDEGTPTAVTYSGNDTAFSVRIGKDLSIEVGRDGEDAFGVTADGIFDTLIDLKNALQNNDVGGIQGAMDKLDQHLNSVRSLISDTGAKSLRLDAKGKILEDLNLTYTDRKSQIEDADIADAIMDLKAKELAYQAALSSSSKVMALSLVDYL
ncbi:MAG: flagellar hook-associated protein FlgL [Deltaproteobacteria bacterium]|nr:flagellar hook-associated protein FlgL [Deltaproteobacteria bacterium]